MSKKGRDLITVLGKPHQGKTTLLKSYILAKVKKPVFIIDPQDEFTDGKIWPDFDSFYQAKPKLEGVHIFKIRSDIQAFKVFTFVAYSGVECSLIVDEIDRYASKHSIDPALYEIIHYGAHNGLSLITTSRRIANTHNDIFAAAEFIITFAQTWGGDVKKIQSEIGTDKDIKGLNQGEFLCLTQQPDDNKLKLSNDQIYKFDLTKNKLIKIS